MNGNDWDMMRQRYEALLPRVGTRDELDDLLAQLMGELCAGLDFNEGLSSVFLLCLKRLFAVWLPQARSTCSFLPAIRKGSPRPTRRWHRWALL